MFHHGVIVIIVMELAWKGRKIDEIVCWMKIEQKKL